MNRQETGMLGERLAREFLIEQGYQIKETNYRCPYDEIDIIAQDEDYLVFVEVRTKRSLEFGTPEQSLTPAKMSHLRAASAHYLQAQGDICVPCRIDVVAIELTREGKPSRMELIKNAIGGN